LYHDARFYEYQTNKKTLAILLICFRLHIPWLCKFEFGKLAVLTRRIRRRWNRIKSRWQAALKNVIQVPVKFLGTEENFWLLEATLMWNIFEYGPWHLLTWEILWLPLSVTVGDIIISQATTASFYVVTNSMPTSKLSTLLNLPTQLLNTKGTGIILISHIYW
jgi:hypothetical protein